MCNISERLLEERKRLDKNQAEMADIGGVSKRAYCNYESGDRNPDSAFLSKIAAIGADVQYILTGVRAAILHAFATRNEHALSEIAEANPGYQPLNKREAALLDNYRHITDDEGQRYVEQSALIAARQGQDEKKPGTKGKIKK